MINKLKNICRGIPIQLIFVWCIENKNYYIDDMYSFCCLLSVKIAMKKNSFTALDRLLLEFGREKILNFQCSMEQLSLCLH